MRSAPEGLDERDLAEELARGWRIDVAAAEHTPVGGGSYHWTVGDASGRRHWVTVDDLDAKGFLGPTRETAFDGLRRALDTAVALREAGLDFVVAPVRALAGEAVRRLGDRHTVAVFPFVQGQTYRFEEPLPPAVAASLVSAVGRLHAATPSAAATVRRWDAALAGRSDLEDALRDLDRLWTGGPFSEPARALVAARADDIRRALDSYDRLRERVAAAGAEPVVTHGEPHPGNLIGAGDRLLLVDWETVGLAPPERDLWMIAARAGGGALARYQEASGRRVDEAAIRLYRMRWPLDDLASFLGRLRAPHTRTGDTEHGWRALAITLESDVFAS